MTDFDPRDLRRAFGSFMTGVCVVTTRDADGTCAGFTANSFASVSLDPPMLLVCPGKSLSSFAMFQDCDHFAVNILAEGQEDVSNTFASYKGDRFAKIAHSLNSHGIPLIDGAIARFSCRAHQAIDAGDHCVLIGQVESYDHNETSGLGYAAGRYFSLGLEREALVPAGQQVVCGAIVECDGQVLMERAEQGLRPPQITLSDRRYLRDGLLTDLAKRGVAANLGAVYSVYDDGTTHHVYLLADTATLPDNDSLVPVQTSDLTQSTFASPALATMMSRFALESKTGGFAFYLGDAEQGDIHSISERK